MKSLVVILCFGILVVLFSNCNKNEGKAVSSKSTGITGTWELRQSQSSMFPAVNYPKGNGNFLKFTDLKYEKYSAGELDKKGNYFITKDSSVATEVGLAVPTGQFTNTIAFDSISSSRKIFLEVSNDSLIFLSGYFPLDGGTKQVYIRQENNN